MPRKTSKAPPVRHEVEVQVDGKRYTGSYYTERGVVKVSYYAGGSKATQLGSSSAEHLAQLMLRELVIEANQKR